MPKRIPVAVLAIVPVCIVALMFSFVKVLGAFPADPNYVYLLSSLNVLSLRSPAYFDHPGTTLQLWGAIVIGTVWLARWPFVQIPLQVDVLLYPQFYLCCINATLAPLIGGAIFAVGLTFYASTKSLATAAAAQATLLISLPVMLALPRVTPEPLLLCLTLILVALVAPVIVADAVETRGRVITAGIVFGSCLVTKLTAGPLALLLFLFHTWRARLIALAAALVAIVALTLPIAKNYRPMLRWFKNLLIHQGIYGSGDVGLPSWLDIGERLVQISRDSPEIIISLLICIAMLFVCIKDRLSLWLFAICAAILALELGAVVKHWLQGTGAHERYLLPAAAVVALVTGVISHRLPRKIAVICVLGGGLSVGIWHNARAVSAWLQEAYAGERDRAELLNQISHSGCAAVPFEGAETQEFKLFYGNWLSGGTFGSLLMKEYPRFVSYNVWYPPHFETFDHILDPAEVERRFAAEKCVYLVGRPVEDFAWVGIPLEALRVIGRLIGRTRHHSMNVAVYQYDAHFRELEYPPPGCGDVMGRCGE
jgi:hypothetical protein